MRGFTSAKHINDLVYKPMSLCPDRHHNDLV